LEFLGDSVLDLAVGEFLYLKYPTEGEGFLTKTRSKIVNRESLNRLALQLGLDKLLESKGEIGKTALGNSLEALIGAIFLDQGWGNAKKFVITKLLNQLIDIEELVSQETDFKSIAIEKCQKEKKKIKFDTKPVQNNKIDTFESNLLIDGKSVSKGTGKSKKEAEQVAAKEWLTSMNQKSKS
jgi:ribonuclease-3